MKPAPHSGVHASLSGNRAEEDARWPHDRG